MGKPIEVAYSDSVIKLIREKASPSCKKCYGTGFVGVLLKKDGGRSHLACKCATDKLKKRNGEKRVT